MNFSNPLGDQPKHDDIPRSDEELLKAQEIIRDLQEELEESNRGLLALSMELEDRVAQRTRELHKANRELLESIAEIKKSQEEVRSLSLFPQQNPNPVMRVSLKGKVLYANEACHPLKKVWTNSDPNLLTNEWRQITKEIYHSKRAQYLDVQSGDQYFSVTFTPIPGSKYVNIYAHDISDRKRAENALQRELDVNSKISGLAQSLIVKPADINVVVESVLECAKLITKSEYGLVSSIDRHTGEIQHHDIDHLNTAYCETDRDTEKPNPAVEGMGPDRLLRELAHHTPKETNTFAPFNNKKSTELPTVHIARQACLSVPVFWGNDLAGQIALANPHQPYDSQDIRAIEQLSVVFAQALQRIWEEEKRREIENKYQQSQKMEAIGTLAGGIAHDFNNILVAILGYVNLSLQGIPKDSVICHNLNQIKKAGNRAKNLIKQILAVSRKGERVAIMMDMDPIVKEVLKLIKSTIPQSIEVKQEIYPAAGRIFANPVEIHQVVMNLCKNAIQAMRKGGGELRVSLTGHSASLYDESIDAISTDRRYLLLEVSDTGAGIPPGMLDRIFEPYFTTKENHEGTGLGLSVVHGIIKRLGGHISVESKLEKGTSFSVYIPVSEKEPTSKSPYKPKKIGRGERILYVDDEKQIVELALQLFPQLGYQITVFEDSVRALDAVKDDPLAFDLVITDLSMPGLDGRVLAQKIKQIRPDIPVIICTGYSESVTAGTAAKFGVDACLLKPLNKDELSKTIRLLLEGEDK